MINMSWMLWAFVMCALLLAPMGYGWGYRGWGAPVPSYVQRRRQKAATASGIAINADYRAWGYVGDFIWVMLIIGTIWAMSFYWITPRLIRV
jgi:hypothetical protein